jgi:hypothetical protein
MPNNQNHAHQKTLYDCSSQTNEHTYSLSKSPLSAPNTLKNLRFFSALQTGQRKQPPLQTPAVPPQLSRAMLNNKILLITFKNYNPILNSSVVIKKELCFWKNNFFGIEDYELWLRLKKEEKRFYNCNEILIKHRIYPNSFFNSKGNSDEENLKKLLDLY